MEHINLYGRKSEQGWFFSERNIANTDSTHHLVIDPELDLVELDRSNKDEIIKRLSDEVQNLKYVNYEYIQAVTDLSDELEKTKNAPLVGDALNAEFNEDLF